MAEEELVARVSVDYDGTGFNEFTKDSKEFVGDVNASARSTGEAGDKVESYSQKLRGLRERLNELTLEQVRYDDRKQRGIMLTDQESRASERRRQQIERLGGVLGRTSRAHDMANEAIQRHAGGTAVLAGSIAKLTGVFGGLLSVSSAINISVQQHVDGVRSLNEYLGKTAELADKAAKATLDLHALSMQFNPADEAFVADVSTMTGRSVDEIGKSFTGFKSATGFLSADEQRNVYKEVVGVMSLGMSGGIDSLGEFTAKASSLERNPLRLRNALATFIKEAGEGDPAQLFGSTTPLLQAGQLGGLSVEDTFSLMALATRSGDSAQSATQLRNIILKFSGDEATRKSLGEMGIGEGDLFSQLNQLGERGMSSEEAVKLVGIENVAALNALTQRRAELSTIRGNIGSAASSPKDLYRDFLKDLDENSPRHKYAIRYAQEQQQLEQVQASGQKGQRARLGRTMLETELTRLIESGKLTPYERDEMLANYDYMIGNGHDVEHTLQHVGRLGTAPVAFWRDGIDAGVAWKSFWRTPGEFEGRADLFRDATSNAQSGLDASFVPPTGGGGGGGGFTNSSGTTIIINEQNNYGTVDPHLATPPRRGPR
jgi:hypothetical protein